MSVSEKMSNSASNTVRVFPIFTMGLIARFATAPGTTWQGVDAHDAGNIMLVVGALGFLFVMFFLSLVGTVMAVAGASRR